MRAIIRSTVPRPKRSAKPGHPEADIQRAIVKALYVALPSKSIVQCCANEIRGGGAKAHRDQGLANGMGVYAGFSDLMVIAAGRVMFLEVKSLTGGLSQNQRAFRDLIQAQGLPWAMVRSVDQALDALRAHGFPMRLRGAL